MEILEMGASIEARGSVGRTPLYEVLIHSGAIGGSDGADADANAQATAGYSAIEPTMVAQSPAAGDTVDPGINSFSSRARPSVIVAAVQACWDLSHTVNTRFSFCSFSTPFVLLLQISHMRYQIQKHILFGCYLWGSIQKRNSPNITRPRPQATNTLDQIRSQNTYVIRCTPLSGPAREKPSHPSGTSNSQKPTRDPTFSASQTKPGKHEQIESIPQGANMMGGLKTEFEAATQIHLTWAACFSSLPPPHLPTPKISLEIGLWRNLIFRSVCPCTHQKFE